VDRLRRRSAAWLFSAAAAVFVLDRLSKVWVARELGDGHTLDLIPGVLTLRYTTNSGGAFSVGQRAPWLFATATIIVSGIIVATAFRHRSVLPALALGLILGGALGNLADRALRGPGLSGRVVDFIDVHFWPIFNLADSAIVVGAVLLAFGSTLGSRSEDAERPGDADAA
jgi:signal peptidase II